MPKLIYCYRKGGALQRINLSNVLFLESADNYVKFVAMDQVHTVRTSLEAALSLLPEDQFLQVHRSFAIAIDQINMIGKYFVTFVALPDKALPVSKKFLPSLLKKTRIIGLAFADR